MTRIVVAVALAAALSALVPATASAQGFTLGVSASEVTSSSALLWARAPRTGRARLQVAVDPRFRRRRITKTVFVKRNDDRTLQTRVAGLAPNQRYWYFFHQGRQRSAVGQFKTAPRPNVAQTIEFAVTGDTEGHKDENGNLYWNRRGAKDMAIYNRMATERNHFNVNLGDVIYSDPTGALRPRLQTAFNLVDKRATYRENLGYKAYQRIRRTGTVYNQWDDHEFINDFTPNSAACNVGAIGPAGQAYACDMKAIQRAGVEAFREYMPVNYSPTNGTYRSFRWGRNLEVFILDERTFRSIRASEVKVDRDAPEPGADHVCDNPMGSKSADPAPQIPQRIRDLFAIVYPAASNPVPKACLDAINDPSRTFLGQRQYNSFTAAIRRSRARWKVVINEMPILAHYFNPWDGWQGYNAERTKLLQFLKANVKNVLFLSTDFHANWVNEANITTFPEEGGLNGSGIWDFVSGVATHLFADELDEFTGDPGSYRLLEDAFLKQAPPNGPGMKCTHGNKFSYAQVTVRAKSVTVVLKDVDGKTVVEEGDNPRTCRFNLTAK